MLHRIRKAMEERDKGYTMVELIAVAVLIGMFAAFAIPKYLAQKERAVDASIKTDLHSAAIQVQTWMTDNPQSLVKNESITHESDKKFTQPTGIEVLDTVVPSNGNTIKVKPKGTIDGTYVLCGFNDNASKAKDATKAYVFDSEAGGLQPDLGACS